MYWGVREACLRLARARLVSYDARIVDDVVKTQAKFFDGCVMGDHARARPRARNFRCSVFLILFYFDFFLPFQKNHHHPPVLHSATVKQRSAMSGPGYMIPWMALFATVIKSLHRIQKRKRYHHEAENNPDQRRNAAEAEEISEPASKRRRLDTLSREFSEMAHSGSVLNPAAGLILLRWFLALEDSELRTHDGHGFCAILPSLSMEPKRGMAGVERRLALLLKTFVREERPLNYGNASVFLELFKMWRACYIGGRGATKESGGGDVAGRLCPGNTIDSIVADERASERQSFTLHRDASSKFSSVADSQRSGKNEEQDDFGASGFNFGNEKKSSAVAHSSGSSDNTISYFIADSETARCSRKGCTRHCVKGGLCSKHKAEAKNHGKKTVGDTLQKQGDDRETSFALNNNENGTADDEVSAVDILQHQEPRGEALRPDIVEQEDEEMESFPLDNEGHDGKEEKAHVPNENAAGLAADGAEEQHSVEGHITAPSSVKLHCPIIGCRKVFVQSEQDKEYFCLPVDDPMSGNVNLYGQKTYPTPIEYKPHTPRLSLPSSFRIIGVNGEKKRVNNLMYHSLHDHVKCQHRDKEQPLLKLLLDSPKDEVTCADIFACAPPLIQTAMSKSERAKALKGALNDADKVRELMTQKVNKLLFPDVDSLRANGVDPHNVRAILTYYAQEATSTPELMRQKIQAYLRDFEDEEDEARRLFEAVSESVKITSHDAYHSENCTTYLT